MATVFISYNRQSETITKILAGDIEALGHDAWFDQDLSGGQAWWDQILAKIRDSDIFVFVLEPESLNSTACRREYRYALDLAKPILPVLASNEVSTNLLPTALSQIQFVKYHKSNREAVIRLARAFNTIPPPAALPDPLPIPPEAPISYLGNLTEQVNTTSTLNYEQQSALLLDLKRALRDSNAVKDVKILLTRFRERKDLLLSIAEEIDDLIIDKSGTALSVSEPEETNANHPAETPSQESFESDRTRSASAASHRKPSFKERLLGALILCSFTVVFHVAFFEWYSSFLSHINSQYAYGFFSLATGGFIAGSICGRRRWGLMIAMSLNIPANLFNLYHSNNGVIGAIVIIAGSIIGVQFSKRYR